MVIIFGGCIIEQTHIFYTGECCIVNFNILQNLARKNDKLLMTRVPLGSLFLYFKTL